MHVALWIDDTLFRDAKAEAARRGLTVTRLIEEALRAQFDRGGADQRECERQAEIHEGNLLMETLLQRTAHFRIGEKPTREEMNER